MPAFVIDASMALAWFLPGEQTPMTDALLQRAGEEGVSAPELWAVEVANSLLISERRGRITSAQRVRALTALSSIRIEFDPQTMLRTWSTVSELAAARDLTVYDAIYLELSLRSGLPLATLDRALCKAATALGVPVLGYSG
jgi:predicted nucleic acid-binding protein